MFRADMILEVAVALAAQHYPPEVGEAFFMQGPIGNGTEGCGERRVGTDAVIELIHHLGNHRAAERFRQTYIMHNICII